MGGGKAYDIHADTGHCDKSPQGEDAPVLWSCSTSFKGLKYFVKKYSSCGSSFAFTDLESTILFSRRLRLYFSAGSVSHSPGHHAGTMYGMLANADGANLSIEIIDYIGWFCHS